MSRDRAEVLPQRLPQGRRRHRQQREQAAGLAKGDERRPVVPGEQRDAIRNCGQSLAGLLVPEDQERQQRPARLNAQKSAVFFTHGIRGSSLDRLSL